MEKTKQEMKEITRKGRNERRFQRDYFVSSVICVENKYQKRHVM